MSNTRLKGEQINQRIIARLQRFGPLSVDTLQECLELGEGTVRKRVAALLARGVLAREPQGREVRYRVVRTNGHLHLSERILAAIQKQNLHIRQIAEELALSTPVVSGHLSVLKRQGRVVQHGYGVWGVAK